MRRNALLIVFLLLSVDAFSQVPNEIAYQGYLTDNTGAPINDTVDLTLSLYTGPAVVDPVWTDVVTGVNVNEGVFDVILGPGGTPVMEEVDFDVPLWLGVEVNDVGELVPKTRLATVPYAMQTRSCGPTIGFLATDSNLSCGDFSGGTNDVPLIFDNEVFDYGSGYDPSTGIFTAPVGGLYSFSATARSDEIQIFQWHILTTDAVILATLMSGNPGGGSTPESASITVQLDEGDQFQVQVMAKVGSVYCDYFSGHLVAEIH